MRAGRSRIVACKQAFRTTECHAVNCEAIRRALDAETALRGFTVMPELQADPPQRAVLQSLWVKPGRHFYLCYRLELRSGASTLASLRLYGDGLSLHVFPDDYRLPALRRCFDLAGVSSALPEGMRLLHCETVSYRPGVRCLLRYGNEDGRVFYAKHSVEREAGRLFRLQQLIYESVRSDHFSVAAPLYYVSDPALTLFAEASGRSFYRSLTQDSAEAGGGTVAAALAAISAAICAFHSTRGVELSSFYTSDDETVLIQGWHRFAASIFPEFAQRYTDALRLLLRLKPQPVLAANVIHRDCYDKQFLLDTGRVAILDLDTVCHGERELDLGNFCAHLLLRRLQGGGPVADRGYEDSFLNRYPGSFDDTRVRWYRRSSLLRLAFNYSLRPQWRHLVPHLLEECLQP